MSQQACNEAWENAVVTYCELHEITVTPPSSIDWHRLRDNVYHSILTPEERDDRPCPRPNECRCPSCKRKADIRARKDGEVVQ